MQYLLRKKYLFLEHETLENWESDRYSNSVQEENILKFAFTSCSTIFACSKCAFRFSRFRRASLIQTSSNTGN